MLYASPAPSASLAQAAGTTMAEDPSTPARSSEASTPAAPRGTRTVNLGESQNLDDVRPQATPARSGGVGQFSQEQVTAVTRLLQESMQRAGGQGLSEQAQEDARLTDILSPSNLIPLLSSQPDFVSALAPHLPSSIPVSSPPTSEEIKAIFSTPQWTEAVATLDVALRTGALQGSMSSMGMTERAGRGVGEFLEEIVSNSKQSQGASGSAATGESKKDEGASGDRMDTD